MNNFYCNEPRYVKKTVLIVDEEQEMVDFLAYRFQSIGLNVSAANNAKTAIRVIESNLPDLIVFDVEMPFGKGHSFLEALDIQAENWHIPAIVLCNTSDLRSVHRPTSLCAYYVHRSQQAWNRIEIFTRELVDLAPDFSGESAKSDHL